MMETNAWLASKPTDKVDDMLDKMREAGWERHGRNWLEAAHDDEMFALWLVLCDIRCGRLIGMGIFDLADFRWADTYESGASPRDAVIECLQEDDLYGEMFAGVE